MLNVLNYTQYIVYSLEFAHILSFCNQFVDELKICVDDDDDDDDNGKQEEEWISDNSY